MANPFRQWFERSFSNPQVAVLLVLLALGAVVIGFASRILAPLMISLVFAYLLDGMMDLLRRWRLSRTLAFALVYPGFLLAVLVALLVLAPLMAAQITDFLGELPSILGRGQALLAQLPDKYPQYFSEQQVDGVIMSLRSEIAQIAQDMLAALLSSIGGFITALIYLVLVPLLIFFFLKDKEVLLRWCASFLPRKENRALTTRIWAEVNQKISGYVRGKLIEIVAVWFVSWIVFQVLGLNYAPLLSFLVGVSVVIPFLGAAVVTIPVALVGYAQWGLSSEFLYVMIAYAVIQFLDGNILVPLLFSEIVNLHPIAIISAVLIFGGLWGIWGVFFAIPLATLVNAVLKAWPRGGAAAAA